MSASKECDNVYKKVCYENFENARIKLRFASTCIKLRFATVCENVMISGRHSSPKDSKLNLQKVSKWTEDEQNFLYTASL